MFTNCGIFGPKLSGKTTLAINISKELWKHCQIRSIVFDPFLDGNWGQQAFVTNDEEIFWKAVWDTKNSLIIVDEAAMAIKRDRKLIPVFTALRHNHHKLIVIGHSGVDLLPVMRQQLDLLFLFRQPKSATVIWSETFSDEQIIKATELNQYEFIKKASYQPVVAARLPAPTQK